MRLRAKTITLTDALGGITSVTEANTTTTSYAYDTLNDLTLVCQGAALVSGLCPSGTQSRAFGYDSLARLKSATNPESGTTAYTYDNNGNLTYKTDANLNDTTLAYDALNRITSKTYTYSSSYYTPKVDYCYDGNTQWPCNTAPSGATNYLVGRLTQVTSSASTTNYSKYSALGDILSSSQTTGGNPYPFACTYNLANAMKTMTQPSGRTFTWTYDIANRAAKLAGAQSGGGTTNYASSIAYASQGPISQFTLGSGLVENRSYDPYRQQPTGVTLGTAANPTSFLNLGFAYCTGAPPPASCTNNNGNLQSQTIATPNVTQTYGYDAYNRLNSAAEKAGSSTVWSETFNYDIYGNRWVPSSSGISLSALTVTSDAYNTLTNRLTSGNFGYDTAGNETTISPFTVTYDVENRQTGFSSISNGTATYTYDGDGRRVTKTTGGVTTTYVYDATGDLASEYSTQPPPPPCLTCYVTTDHLGSTRVVTDETAAITARHDFLPFGEELTTSNRTAALGYGAYDNVMHKYTGKERDAESGLDFFGARYFSGAQGRFTSPDEPFADQHPEDPQSWNLYGYVRNNPLKNTDPNGKDCQNGVAACANYFAGAFGAVVNAFSSGLINAPNHIANAVISLTGSDFRFPDAVQPAFTPANEEQQQGQQAANAVMLVAPVAEAGATALVEAVGTGTRVEAAAAAATDVPTSIPAGPTARPTAAQQAAINEMGDAHGCNTCGTSNPGTQSGNWVGDHQPPTALNPPGGAQVYQPQCLQCSRQQGGQVAAAVKAAKKAACTTGSNGTTTCQ